MISRFKPRQLFRFSIATLLFAMLCQGGYLSGYRVGFDAGKQEGVNQLVAAVSGPRLIVKTYPVADLVTPATTFAGTAVADFDSLIDAIIVHVSPADWMENGTGQGEIQSFPTNLSLVISQTEANHQAVAALLEQFRQAQRTVAAPTGKSSS